MNFKREKMSIRAKDDKGTYGGVVARDEVGMK